MVVASVPSSDPATGGDTVVPVPVQAPAWASSIAGDVLDQARAVLDEAVDEGRSIVLACHIGPDGDALGSMLALHLWLRSRGADVTSTWGEPELRVPPALRVLPHLDLLSPVDDVPGDPSVLVTLDAGSVERLGAVAGLAERAGTVVVFDHHASNTGFGDVRVVAPGAAATAVLVEALLRRAGADITPAIATCLYVALVTDTGRFQYANTDPDAHALAARLLRAGVDHEILGRRLFASHSFGYVKVLGALLDRALRDPEHGIVWSWLPATDLDRHGVALDETEAMIDDLRVVDDAHVTVLLREGPDGDWRVSLRSHPGDDEVDVSRIAVALGGGGHRYSAGFTASGAPEAVLDTVRDALSASGTR